MKQLVEEVARNLPREIKNFQLIKRQDIYIPYCEIGISCLTREITEINLFFESILKLINIEVTNVYEISEILGVEFKLLKEAIVDMIDQKYIITSQNKLHMTPKGRKALNDRKLVTISKRNLNGILINMITGSVEESARKTFSHPHKRDICLNEEQTISKDFLESNYSVINEIYQQNQIETSIFNTTVFQRELYKILDVIYEKQYYVKDELLIYKNNDSEDYEFIIEGDIGNCYQKSFYRQVKDVVYSGMDTFFEKDWKFAQGHYHVSIASQDEKQYTRRLIGKLNESESISDELLDEYKHVRALIDENELKNIFLFNRLFDYEGIIVSCERLKKMLIPEIINSLLSISRKKTYFLYNSKEHNVVKFLEEKFEEKIKKDEIVVLENDHLTNQFICFYPNVLVEFIEKTEKVFEKPITILEGRIDFRTDYIRDNIDAIIDEYKVSFEIAESKKNKQSKHNKSSEKVTAQQYKKHRRKKK